VNATPPAPLKVDTLGSLSCDTRPIASFPRSGVGTFPVPLRGVRNVNRRSDSGPVPYTLDIVPCDTLAFVYLEPRPLAVRA
jgi:hypothetical protein